MKKDDIFIVIVLLGIIVAIILAIILYIKKDERQISTINYFRFSYTKGMMANSGNIYEIECKTKCKSKIKLDGYSYDSVKEIEIDKKYVEELEQLLKKYKVGKWNGFEKYNKNIMDGSSFNLFIEMKNGDKIEAKGYMKWPDNFNKVKSELDYLFKQISKTKDKNPSI